ncbi:MAG: sigma-70 family RNA polymerase sigma factor [Acidimicrobiales bacterium]
MSDEEVNGVRQLVARAIQHDPDAWEVLYRRAYPRLHAYARRRLSTDQAADDAVSETMTRALDRVDGFTWRGAGFDAWLTGILRNVVLEAYRSHGRPVPVAAFIDRSEPGPLDQVIEHHDRARVRAAFERLPLPEQEVLELRVVQGLTAEGAAEVLGRGPGAVRMAQSRALTRLRTLFEEQSDAV